MCVLAHLKKKKDRTCVHPTKIQLVQFLSNFEDLFLLFSLTFLQGHSKTEPRNARTFVLRKARSCFRGTSFQKANENWPGKYECPLLPQRMT